uniref:Uncharacterized protein n=1 Tax=Oryza barthii TaxID=65489 RepID=A0A0D3FD43_9ORYZ
MAAVHRPSPHWPPAAVLLSLRTRSLAVHFRQEAFPPPSFGLPAFSLSAISSPTRHLPLQLKQQAEA